MQEKSTWDAFLEYNNVFMFKPIRNYDTMQIITMPKVPFEW